MRMNPEITFAEDDFRPFLNRPTAVRLCFLQPKPSRQTNGHMPWVWYGGLLLNAKVDDKTLQIRLKSVFRFGLLVEIEPSDPGVTLWQDRCVAPIRDSFRLTFQPFTLSAPVVEQTESEILVVKATNGTVVASSRPQDIKGLTKLIGKAYRLDSLEDYLAFESSKQKTI